tara:strand:- start:57 stop:644 length:588 start_codon:yes stop_codon:yes gene_type:complete
MKRSFDNSIQHARSKYLPVVSDEQPVKVNRTDNLIEGMMNDLAGSVKKGIGKVAGATQKIRTFAQNQKHGGTFAAMGNAGMFDPKGDSQLVRAEWDKLDAGAKEAWQQKGQDFTPSQEGADYFYNFKMQARAKAKTDAAEGISTPAGGGTQTQQTPAQQEQAWREDFRNKPNIIQWAQGNGMDEQGYVDLMKAQQ